MSVWDTPQTGIQFSQEDISLSKNHFHNLRHTHTTMLYEQGVPGKVISERAYIVPNLVVGD